ncbi:MAG: Clp protease ClpP [Firmicutes bacterium]|jgi:ATP-dependent Clp protease protease subunit|nr:Clp protease ClpP [Bacillota bacterium]DAJ40314.1 MAG TPA: Putative ATP dependent Clp protease [Caudoviricetes sp.]DAP90756.1 MAG TPA: Putative ATP dependent Clp protease [Caudoviricetes sp.]DAU66516.1 MAG TPA: Putative ATP dependent Clp protease [Caudoviricetes sp.]DAU82883.1 MAG TPA: Putative ATP dependent Clp protease [Caudoviricetes sp.]
MRKIEVKGTIVGNADKWIYEWFGMDATCPKDVNAAISEANGEPLLVEINSGGGDVFAGSEIYTALKAYAGTVEINIVGLAASAASVIAQAGHSRISPTALFMVHNVSGSAAGDFHDMQQEAEILQTANKAVAAAYLEKTGKSMEELLGIMDAETWMDAQKAVEYGFVDEVMFASAPTLTNGIGVLPAQTIHKLKDLLPARGEENAEVKTVTAKLKLLRLKGEMKDEV